MLKTSNLLADQVTEALSRQLDDCREFPTVVSTSLDIAPLSWVDAQNTHTKIVWLGRDGHQSVGTGIAASVTAEPNEDSNAVVRRCRTLCDQHPLIRVFGGFSFDGTDDWPEFGAGRFVVPRFTLENGNLQLAIMNEADVEAAREAIRDLQWSIVPQAQELPCPVSIDYLPTRDGWQANVDQALTLIRSEVLEKVVLARKARLTFDEALNPIQLTAKLADATHDCFVFCFLFGDTAFVGATPERLFKREGSELWSEVVAGTRKRGATTGEDQRLAYDLLTSEKDQLEHDIVRKSIRQKLHKFVEHLEVDDHASVLRLARKQHLCSEVVGTLKPNVSEGSLLRCLHPTPAVGGYPTENAMSEIARLEPFNRGWYAAPIGWLGGGEAEFAVGIRSGLVRDNQLALYSGAGIVKGSEPDREWEEIENKIQDFVDIFDA